MLRKVYKERLNLAKEVRESLSHKEGILVGLPHSNDRGMHLSNFANCLLNRQLDIFDDAIFLLENDRIPSACTISRGMIETHAFAKLLATKVAKTLNAKSGKESAEEALDLVIKFINSSRIKETEQKKIKKGVYDPNDYQFTDQAKYRFENMLAASEHVMNALRDVYKNEMKFSGEKQSQIEMAYDLLSEWVHPSQTSIFHNYVPDTHNVPTSLGRVNIFDNAKLQCATALAFIVEAADIHATMTAMAEEITKRDSQAS
ncbi:TPA: hypothetical protein ACPJ2O_004660 [Vibrio diabolicus]